MIQKLSLVESGNLHEPVVKDILAAALCAHCLRLIDSQPDKTVVVQFSPHFSVETAREAVKLLRRDRKLSVFTASRHETKQLARGWRGPDKVICLALKA